MNIFCFGTKKSKTTSYFENEGICLVTQKWAISMYLEPPVVLGHCVRKIDLLPLAHKLLKFWMLLHPDVIPNEVPVNAVSPSLLLVQQEV